MKNNASVIWKRHTLIWLTAAGRLHSANHILTPSWEAHESDTWKKNLIYNQRIPGVICRQTSESESTQPVPQPGFLLAGFSHWKYDHGCRLRMTARFQEAEVLRCCSPFDLCIPDERNRLCRTYPLLEAVFSAADSYGIEPGLFGSTALEWVTGYPYRNQNSDIDLCIRMMPGCDLKGFGKTLALLEEQYKTRIDVEMETECGYGIKLKEFLSPSKTVLGKGIYDIKIFEKPDNFF